MPLEMKESTKLKNFKNKKIMKSLHFITKERSHLLFHMTHTPYKAWFLTLATCFINAVPMPFPL